MDSAAKPFAESLTPARARAIPWASVMAASTLGALVPVVASLPLMPPPGLLLLLAWRLLSRFALRPWAAAPLGLWDDLTSGQPLGSAMLLWSLCFIAIEAVDHRLAFRNLWQDWILAALAIALCLGAGRLIAVPLSAPVDRLLGAQIAIAILCFPLAVRAVAWIDRRRGPHA